MNNNQNIWEIVSLNDLVKILKESPKKFVIVGITLNSTPQGITKMIKKFLKVKSKIYPNITFLYYNAKDADLGRISLLSKDKEQYPFIYHVYDTSHIFVSVNMANEETTYTAFAEVEDYYKKDKENFIHKEPNNENDNENVNIQINNIQPNNDNENQIPEEDEEAEQQRKIIEQKRMLEKLLLLQKHAKDYNIKFLSIVQDRKKREMKSKTKE
jgi:hypothetical protein